MDPGACWLLVALRDSPGGFHRGDVIHVAPDGHAHSPEERDHPRWRLIRAVLHPEQAAALEDGEIGHGPQHELYTRGRRLDLDRLVEDRTYTGDEILAATVLKVR